MMMEFRFSTRPLMCLYTKECVFSLVVFASLDGVFSASSLFGIGVLMHEMEESYPKCVGDVKMTVLGLFSEFRISSISGRPPSHCVNDIAFPAVS